MELLNQFKTENLKKPQNRRWKLVSKFLTRTLPIYAGAVMPLPIAESIKLWIVFGLSIIVATISGLSEFTTQNQ